MPFQGAQSLDRMEKNYQKKTEYLIFYLRLTKIFYSLLWRTKSKRYIIYQKARDFKSYKHLNVEREFVFSLNPSGREHMFDDKRVPGTGPGALHTLDQS